MLTIKIPFLKNMLLAFLATSFITLITTSIAAAQCSSEVINNFVDIDPYVASTYNDPTWTYYPMSNGQSYDYTDIHGAKHSYTINGVESGYAVHHTPTNVNIIPFFRATVNGAGGSAPLGTSETLVIDFNTGPGNSVNFLISDVDHFEGTRVIGYLDGNIVTPTITGLSANQTLSYLISGEAQWFSDTVSTDDVYNTVTFNQPINRLAITSYKPINGNNGGSGSFSLHELNATICDYPKAVPTLSEWGLILMTMLLGIVGFGLNPSRVYTKD